MDVTTDVLEIGAVGVRCFVRASDSITVTWKRVLDCSWTDEFTLFWRIWLNNFFLFKCIKHWWLILLVIVNRRLLQLELLHVFITQGMMQTCSKHYWPFICIEVRQFISWWCHFSELVIKHQNSTKASHSTNGASLACFGNAAELFESYATSKQIALSTCHAKNWLTWPS